MSLSDMDTTGRNRNVLAPPVETITVSPASGSGSNTPGTISGNYVIFFTSVNLLAALDTNTLIFTVPATKRFVLEEVTYVLDTVVGSTATTLPTVQLFRGTGTNSVNQISNTFNFANLTIPVPLVSYYWVRGGNTTSQTGRRVAVAGENINCRITVAYQSGGATPYITLTATCIVTGYLV
jgi:hypothetical protein